MEAPPLERKLAAILAADVEGYSRLMHEDEERTLATLTAHRSIVDDLIATANGQIFGTAGDSVLAEFPSVVDAVNCAVAIQQALKKANAELPDDAEMHLRIGINVGDVMVKDGDIFGDGVNIAARLEALAPTGGICVTRGVRDHLRDRVAYTFEDLGEHSVKNIARPIRAFRICFDPDAEPVIVADPDRPAVPRNGSPAARGAAPNGDVAEIAFWQSAQASDEDNEYRLYLERYPNGNFAELARARLEGGGSGDPPKIENAVEVTFWRSVQANDSDDGYRIYLQRYPKGAFADLARARLETGANGGDSEIEMSFWETVRDSGDPTMIRAYLEKYPDGEFRPLAEILLRNAGEPAKS